MSNFEGEGKEAYEAYCRARNLPPWATGCSEKEVWARMEADLKGRFHACLRADLKNALEQLRVAEVEIQSLKEANAKLERDVKAVVEQEYWR